MERGEVRESLRRLREVADPRRRRLVMLGLLTAWLGPVGIEPILVGGAALEFYTAGGYATGDVDLALPAGPEIDAAFAALGFEKEGRFWYHAELDLLFEAPAPAGLPGEDAPRTEVDVDGLRVVVIGVEDLLVGRLRAWVRWKSDEDGRWTVGSRTSTRTAWTGAICGCGRKRFRKKPRPCSRSNERRAGHDRLRRVPGGSATLEARALGEDPRGRAAGPGARKATAGSGTGAPAAQNGPRPAATGATLVVVGEDTSELSCARGVTAARGGSRRRPRPPRARSDRRRRPR